MNHFPRAFDSYEEKHDIGKKGIKTFEQLKNSFDLWATDYKGKKRYIDSKEQKRALAIEADKRGLKTYERQDIPIRGYKVSYISKTGKTVQYERKFHIQHVIREIYGRKTVDNKEVSVSGRFVSGEEYERDQKERNDEIDE
jgi:hypothetical protein